MNFFRSFKKGSKSIRSIITAKRFSKIDPTKINCMVTFSGLIGCPMPEADSIKRCLSLWGLNFLSNTQREFCFKFYNNSLGLNCRVANFVPNHSNECTFCISGNLPHPSSETFSHLFIECTQLQCIINHFCDNLLQELELTTMERKKSFLFFGITPIHGKNDNTLLQVIACTFMYTIWHFKLSKRCPMTGPFFMKFYALLFDVFSASKKMLYMKNNLDLTICRNWDTLQHRRG